MIRGVFDETMNVGIGILVSATLVSTVAIIFGDGTGDGVNVGG
jgi:hypothetical protein